MLDLAFLSRRFALGICPTSHFCRGVLPSVHACCLPHGDKQDGLRCVAFLFRRVEIAICAFSYRLGLSALTGSLWICAFLCGDLDGLPGYGGTRNGERRWRCGLCALLRKHIGLVMLSAGSTLGLRAPDCAKESSTLWTLFTLRRGYVCAYTRRAVTRVHGKTRPALIYGRAGRAVQRSYQYVQSEACLTLTYGQAGRVALRGSKWKPHCGWPGGSGCIAIISTRTIGDLPDSDLWSGRSCCIARQQVSAGTAGRVDVFENHHVAALFRQRQLCLIAHRPGRHGRSV